MIFFLLPMTDEILCNILCISAEYSEYLFTYSTLNTPFFCSDALIGQKCPQKVFYMHHKKLSSIYFCAIRTKRHFNSALIAG